jgi:hypothetical protein
MITFILAVAALATFHWIYESILAPSFRLDLRFQLFALRDELRVLKMDFEGDLKDKHFDYLQDSINALISMLSRLDWATLHAITKELGQNSDLRLKIEARTKVLDDCTISQARDIRRRSVHIASHALIVNTGGFILYALPFVLAMTGIAALRSQYKRQINDLLSVPGPELRRVAPCASGEAVLTKERFR